MSTSIGSRDLMSQGKSVTKNVWLRIFFLLTRSSWPSFQISLLHEHDCYIRGITSDSSSNYRSDPSLIKSYPKGQTWIQPRQSRLSSIARRRLALTPISRDQGIFEKQCFVVAAIKIFDPCMNAWSSFLPLHYKQFRLQISDVAPRLWQCPASSWLSHPYAHGWVSCSTTYHIALKPEQKQP